MTARGAGYQRFNRALKESEWDKDYQIMPGKLKEEFRRSWAISRCFDFTKEARQITIKHEESEKGKEQRAQTSFLVSGVFMAVLSLSFLVSSAVAMCKSVLACFCVCVSVCVCVRPVLWSVRLFVWSRSSVCLRFVSDRA